MKTEPTYETFLMNLTGGALKVVIQNLINQTNIDGIDNYDLQELIDLVKPAIIIYNDYHNIHWFETEDFIFKDFINKYMIDYLRENKMKKLGL